jgi:hypothetical protein
MSDEFKSVEGVEGFEHREFECFIGPGTSDADCPLKLP